MVGVVKRSHNFNFLQPMNMASLNSKHKELIIKRLACFTRSVEVQTELKESFGIDVSLDQVGYYNPETANGSKLAEKWKQLYRHTREEYMTVITKHPIANKGFRLGELQKNYERASKNIVLQNQILEQAAKEVGRAYEKGEGDGDNRPTVNNFIQQIYNRIEGR